MSNCFGKFGVKPEGECNGEECPKCSGPQLREYQKEGAARLIELCKKHGGAILSDDMGLGKTAQSISVANQLRGSGDILIVCPASVRAQWCDEIRKWAITPYLVFELGPPSKAKFKKNWAQCLEVTCQKYAVVSYNLAEKAADIVKPRVLIIDEAHNIKGRRNPWVNVLKDLARSTPYRLALTGTPIWSRPRDFWSILNIVGGYKVSETARNFDLRYCNGHDGAWGWVNDGATNLNELQERVAGISVRRTKGEVLKELPDITRVVRWVDAKPGSEAKREFKTALVDGKSDNAWPAIRATLEEKIPEAVAACVQAGQFVCFTHLREHSEKIAELINAEGIKAFVINGKMPADMRVAIIAKAYAENAGLVATIDSCSAGVNLQHVAYQGVMHTIDWVPAKLMQAEGRLHRIGQKNAVTWTYIALRESIDERIVHQVVNRLDTWRLTMESKGDGSQDLRSAFTDTEVADKAVLDSLFAELMSAEN